MKATSTIKSAATSAEKTAKSAASLWSIPRPVEEPNGFLEIAKRHRFFKYMVLDIHGKKSGRLHPRVLCTNLGDSLFDNAKELEEAGNTFLFDRLAKTNVPFGWRLGIDGATGQRISSAPTNDWLVELFKKRHIRGGYCVPLYTLRGRRHVVIYCAEHLNKADQQPELVLETQECFQKTFGQDNPPETKRTKNLNAGERRCLLWAARGKTSHEISIILGLSEHTVNRYFTLAVQKLGASGRIQAVVNAIDAGLIDLQND